MFDYNIWLNIFAVLEVYIGICLVYLKSLCLVISEVYILYQVYTL